MTILSRLLLPSYDVKIFILLIFFVVYSSSCASSEFNFFDSYLDRQFVTNQFQQQKVPLDFVSDTVDNKRSYAYTLKFEQTSENQYYLFGVYVSKAGELLDIKEFDKDYKNFVSKNPKPKKIEIEFPNIGKRARRDAGFFGPGGSSYGLVFTTSDGLYDVKLVESLLLPANVAPPNIDIRQFARTISSAYDSYVSKD